MDVYVCVYVCVYAYVYMCMCVYVCVYVYVCICMCVCVYVYVYVCICMCVCVCVYMYVHYANQPYPLADISVRHSGSLHHRADPTVQTLFLPLRNGVLE